MSKTYFIWDPIEDNIVKEFDGGGASVAAYTTEPGLYGGVISQNRGGLESQFHYDAQGSTLTVTDESQTTTDTRAYSAYGETAENTGSTTFPFQYVGRSGYYLTAATNQYYVRRRIYVPQCARWQTCDPLRLKHPNESWRLVAFPYVYCDNMPIVHRDPSGLTCECCCCVADADISLIATVGPKEVMTDFGNAIIWGHDFEHIANLDLVPGTPAKCSFEWFECTSDATPEMREKVKMRGKWFDAYDVFKDITETGKHWRAYEAGDPPFDKLTCPSHLDISSIDTPQVPNRIRRVVFFAIRVKSGDNCGCKNKSVTSYATQILRPAFTDENGTRVEAQQEFIIGPLRRQPELPDCGNLPA